MNDPTEAIAPYASYNGVTEVAAGSTLWQSDNPDIVKKNSPNAATHSMGHRFANKSNKVIMGG